MIAGDANALLEGAFLKLVEEKPFAKITVNDIVKEAGVHRNTFYYHYQSIPVHPGFLNYIIHSNFRERFLFDQL